MDGVILTPAGRERFFTMADAFSCRLRDYSIIGWMELYPRPRLMARLWDYAYVEHIVPDDLELPAPGYAMEQMGEHLAEKAAAALAKANGDRIPYFAPKQLRPNWAGC